MLVCTGNVMRFERNVSANCGSMQTKVGTHWRSASCGRAPSISQTMEFERNRRSRVHYRSFDSICYGMLAFTTITQESVPSARDIHPCTPVSVENGNVVLRTLPSLRIARLEEYGEQVLGQLAMQAEIDVQYHCTSVAVKSGHCRARKRPPPIIELSAVLYGPENLS